VFGNNCILGTDNKGKRKKQEKISDLMFLKNKVVLVTGASGFIGSHIVDRCLKEGAEKVIGLDNFASGLNKNIMHLKGNERFEIVNGDVRDFKLIKNLVEKSDYVFHEAAAKLVNSLKNPRLDLETNIIGPFNIMEAAKDSDVRIIHASTGSVFSSSDKPMKETHVKDPVTFYGISKLAGEKYCLHFAEQFGVKVSVLRYFHVYGPRQDYSGEAGVVSIFLSKTLKKEPLTVYGGEQVRCFTYVDDDVEANMLLAKKKESIGQDYNVASKTRITIKELAEKIIKKYGGGSEIIYKPYKYGERLKPIPDTTKIEKLGFSAKTSFEEGLEKTKKWVEEDLKN